MRITAFDKAGKPTLGVRRGDDIIDLSVAAPELPGDLPGLLAAGPDAMAAAKAKADKAPSNAVVSAQGVTYHPTIWNAEKYICVGLNYVDHAKEGNFDIPKTPIFFLRVPGSMVAHQQPIIRPKASDKLDYEAEMIVVIGKAGRHISAAEALDYVAGYSVCNEGSVRDYQVRGPQWTLGKNFDHTGGFGPDFVTADEVPPGGDGLRIQTRLNGETLQDSKTSEMIFKVPALIEALSEVMTLTPGDVIISGTPAGVGFARKPRVWMKDGDTCEIEIEGIGTLVNPVKDEV